MSENTFTPKLAKANELYMPLIEKQLAGNEIEFSEYSKRCVLNAIGSINQVLSNAGITWNDPSLDQSNLTQTLLNIASLELNSSAEPSECYFQIRNVKKKEDGKEVWKKMIEFGIQAGGNDAILARFGRDVEKVYPCWLVREDDDFEYPRYKGVEYEPPTWTPKGHGKVVRVVYPILHKDKSIHYYIGERADVARNLLAHINNNLMNETFGICKDRYNATADQLKQINAKKAEVKDKAKSLGLEAISDPEIAKYISPAWKEDFSSESMIIRKMQNNVVKKIPKDFRTSLVQESYSEASDEDYREAKRTIVESVASVEVEDLRELGCGMDAQNGAMSDEPSKDDAKDFSADIDRPKPNFD